MDIGTIEIGVDLATSISILGATATFIYQSRKERRMQLSEGIDDSIKSALADEIGENLKLILPVWRVAYKSYERLKVNSHLAETQPFLSEVSEFQDNIMELNSIFLSLTFTLCPIFEAAGDNFALSVYDHILVNFEDSITRLEIYRVDLVSADLGYNEKSEITTKAGECMTSANEATKAISGIFYQMVSRNPKGGMAQALLRYTTQ